MKKTTQTTAKKVPCHAKLFRFPSFDEHICKKKKRKFNKIIHTKSAGRHTRIFIKALHLASILNRNGLWEMDRDLMFTLRETAFWGPLEFERNNKKKKRFIPSLPARIRKHHAVGKRIIQFPVK